MGGISLPGRCHPKDTSARDARSSGMLCRRPMQPRGFDSSRQRAALPSRTVTLTLTTATRTWRWTCPTKRLSLPRLPHLRITRPTLPQPPATWYMIVLPCRQCGLSCWSRMASRVTSLRTGVFDGAKVHQSHQCIAMLKRRWSRRRSRRRLSQPIIPLPASSSRLLSPPPLLLRLKRLSPGLVCGSSGQIVPSAVRKLRPPMLSSQ